MPHGNWHTDTFAYWHINFCKDRNYLCAYKTFVYPFHTVPTANKDDTPNVFVQQKGHPHTTQTPTPMNSKQIASAYCHSPHYNQTDVKRIVHIACCTQSIGSKILIGRPISSTVSIISTITPIRIISGLVVSHPKIVCPKAARIQERIKVIITDFFITYFPNRKAA